MEPVLDNFFRQFDERLMNHRFLLTDFTCLINPREINEIKFNVHLRMYSSNT